MIPDTGHTATAVFEAITGVSDSVAFTARMKQIGETNRSVGSLDVSALDSVDEMEKIPDDLIDPGSIECEFFWDSAVEPPEPGQRSIVTVTLPTAPDQATPGSYTASGFFTTKVVPTAQLGNVLMGKATFVFDGRHTKFTYTAATAAS